MAKVTAITAQQRTPNRVNVMVDGEYRFSLDIFQVTELDVRIGKEYSDDELRRLQDESLFGRLYARALDYTMLRPHSAKEMKEYLWKKTLTKRLRSKKTGELYERKGVTKEIADRVFLRLIEKGYIDDTRFAYWWVENRNLRKGTSKRRLEAELRAKGVSNDIVQEVISRGGRDDLIELRKMIDKKASKYANNEKLMQYLLRQGFSYEDVKSELDKEN